MCFRFSEVEEFNFAPNIRSRLYPQVVPYTFHRNICPLQYMFFLLFSCYSYRLSLTIDSQTEPSEHMNIPGHEDEVQFGLDFVSGTNVLNIAQL